jgi:hypothetical protein
MEKLYLSYQAIFARVRLRHAVWAERLRPLPRLRTCFLLHTIVRTKAVVTGYRDRRVGGSLLLAALTSGGGAKASARSSALQVMGSICKSIFWPATLWAIETTPPQVKFT